MSKIKLTLEEMPEYLSTQHLIDLGIYSSIDDAYHARRSGYTPKFIKMRHKILYPKKDLIEYLKDNEHFTSNNTDSEDE